MKKQILILGAFLMPFCVYAEEAELPSCGENCTYYIKGDTLIVEPIDTSKSAVVKGYHRDCTDSCHTDAPWYGNTAIKKVEIKEGIQSIGSNAFEDMSHVTSLSLPEGLKSIGSEAFHGMKITSLDLPSTLTNISQWAFQGSPIMEINGIPAGVTTLNAQVFGNIQVKDFVIPANITSIASNAFGSSKERYGKSIIENLYCEESMVSQCEAALQWRKDNGADVKVIPYQSTSNGQVFYNNKWYDSANDILSNNYAKKRIYTVDEANKVSGRKNTFKIRYK